MTFEKALILCVWTMSLKTVTSDFHGTDGNKDPGSLRSFKDAVSPFPSHTPPEGGEVCVSLLGE